MGERGPELLECPLNVADFKVQQTQFRRGFDALRIPAETARKSVEKTATASVHLRVLADETNLLEVAVPRRSRRNLYEHREQPRNC